ncbi:hypothetical protein QBC41DRAFT_143107 [Cercophora samala]|uniref:Uncharacterized protein n=1 Tax=Cercophora samala TaxID=330535 RepID=A0AA39Z9X5_9PEZI|nr:hypothetical protein QBC41DRAFT_143107 [Cercophora samala]
MMPLMPLMPKPRRGHYETNSFHKEGLVEAMKGLGASGPMVEQKESTCQSFIAWARGNTWKIASSAGIYPVPTRLSRAMRGLRRGHLWKLFGSFTSFQRRCQAPDERNHASHRLRLSPTIHMNRRCFIPPVPPPHRPVRPSPNAPDWAGPNAPYSVGGFRLRQRKEPKIPPSCDTTPTTPPHLCRYLHREKPSPSPLFLLLSSSF